MTHNILFVDDEENILKSMERIFHGSPFNLFFANSGEEGLKIIKDQEMSVIISDMKMPRMSGVEFLRRSKDYCVDATRIILSGYSDIQDIMNAVNEGHVHNYLTKPWENERLKIIIYNGTLNYEKNRQMKDLAKELQEKNKLLKEMNSNLEEVVRRRSLELFERNRILTLMLSSPEPMTNIKETLNSLMNLIGPRKFYFHMDSAAGLEGLEQDSPPPGAIVEKAREIGKTVLLNEYLAVPFLRDEKSNGILFIYPFVEEDKKFIHEINSLMKLMSLIFKQQYYLTQSEEILESYDVLMEELSD
ncbi:MAG: response regulator [Spirochaetales bacterium]|nr:response regulator [Spirochaetales bacterium]